MIRKVVGIVTIASALIIVSCKQKDQFSEIKIDQKSNMVVANDEFTGGVTNTQPKTTMKPEDYPGMEIENNGEFDFGTITFPSSV